MVALWEREVAWVHAGTECAGTGVSKRKPANFWTQKDLELVWNWFGTSWALTLRR
jgi:hypothetical protein